MPKFFVIHWDRGNRQVLTDVIAADNEEGAIAIADRIRGEYSCRVATYTVDELRVLAAVIEEMDESDVLAEQNEMIAASED
jgi:hypothetical protein